MEILSRLLSVESSLAEVMGYKLSLVECIGILSGVASVYWATKRNPLTWPAGLLNEAAFLCIFYQVQLYSDMLLQIFFAGTTLYGWASWSGTNVRQGGAVSPFSTRRLHLSLLATVLGTILLGALMSSIHSILPWLVIAPAAYPFQDGFTAAASIVATILLARRAIESWLLWIGVDLVSIPLYFARSIPFMGVLYIGFLGLAVSGLLAWLKVLDDEAWSGLR